MTNTIYPSKKPYIPFTYLIGWTELDMWYYGTKYARGCHPDDLWTKYKTSSIPVKKFREQYGEPDIIQVDEMFETALEARTYEAEFLTSFNAGEDPNWLNRSNGGKNFCNGSGYNLSEKTREKMRKPKSEEHRAKIKLALNNRSPEIVAKITAHNQSAEGRAKNSAGNKGRKHSEQSRYNMSQAQMGHKHSEETIERMRSAALARGPDSEATIAKKRASALKKPKVTDETRNILSIRSKGKCNVLNLETETLETIPSELFHSNRYKYISTLSQEYKIWKQNQQKP